MKNDRQRERDRLYRAKNRDKIRRVAHQWQVNNREKLRAKGRRYLAAHREKMRAANSRRGAERQALVNQIKMDAGCSLCGFRAHPAALDFDHIDPANKTTIVGRLLRGRIENLLAEIAKCRVLCANCHRIETSKDGRVKAKTRAAISLAAIPVPQRETVKPLPLFQSDTIQ